MRATRVRFVAKTVAGMAGSYGGQASLPLRA